MSAKYYVKEIDIKQMLLLVYRQNNFMYNRFSEVLLEFLYRL